MLPPNHHRFAFLFPTVSRLLTLLMLLLASHVIWCHATGPGSLHGEQGLIEITQDHLLLLMAGLSLTAAYALRQWRELFIALGAVFTMMLIREQNNWFKRELFDGAWQVGVALVLLAASGYLVPRWRKLVAQTLTHRNTLPAVTGFTGLMVLVVFSRLFGRKEIWQGMMESHYQYHVKMMIEESIELLGYSLMLAGVISLILYLKLGACHQGVNRQEASS